MYVFPATEEEIDRIDQKNDQITLKSYGLPLIFWGYLIALLGVIFVMFVAIKNPLLKVLNSPDPINKILAIAVFALLIGLPIILLCFYFYEKRINKNKNILSIGHYIFGIKIKTKKIELKENTSIEVRHLLSTPNVAKQKGDEELRGFQNKGYFQLLAINIKGEEIFVDRHSRKADLIKIKELLCKY